MWVAVHSLVRQPATSPLHAYKILLCSSFKGKYLSIHFVFRFSVSHFELYWLFICGPAPLPMTSNIYQYVLPPLMIFRLYFCFAFHFLPVAFRIIGSVWQLISFCVFFFRRQMIFIIELFLWSTVHTRSVSTASTKRNKKRRRRRRGRWSRRRIEWKRLLHHVRFCLILFY